MQRGEVKPPRPTTAVFLLAALALFSLLFSLAAENDLWPRLPAGALHDTDLWAGFAAGIALLLLLVRGGARTRGREDAEMRGRGDAGPAGEA
jgi:hypothetical protein